MKRKAKLPSMGRDYVKTYERLYPGRYRAEAKRKSVTKLVLAQVGILLIAALLVAGLFGCGKDAADGLPGPAGAVGPKGEKGDQGAPGPKGTDAILAIIDPCGDSPTVIDEILIILADGRVLVSLSDQANGKNTRLALLPPGTYVTTDGSSCTFTVNADSTISY